MLEVLARHGVKVVVIGGFAAWLHGAPIVTADLDLVFDREADNIRRLVDALRELNAVYRDPSGRRIEPSAAAFAATTGGGHHLFQTNAGDLDVLRDSSGIGYGELLPSSIEIEIEGIRARFASLNSIIDLKTRAGRPKDLAVLPVLRAVLEDNEE